MKHLLLCSFATAILLGTAATSAQDSPKLSVSPTGRILVDGALYFGGGPEFVDGGAIPDVRIGAKVTYGKWKGKIDIGYGYGKVSLKDIFVEYDFNTSNLLRIGNFVHQYGLQSATSSSMKVTMEEPTSNEIFNNPRLIGAMYVYDGDKYFGTVSAHIESEALKKTSNELGKTGYGFMTRQVYRPIHDNGYVLQVGISGGYATPRYDADEELSHTSFVFTANYPTRVAKVEALNATVTDARNWMKFTPELLAGYGPLALESQYYFNQVNRKGGAEAYNASGAYVILRGLAIGGDYQYSHADAGLATPGPGSLECVAAYNYTDMNDGKAGIRGGILNDASFTVNYYINKYMIARLRYSYTHVTGRSWAPDNHVNIIQARFQISF